MSPLYVLLIPFLLLATTAYGADCSAPDGIGGEIIFNVDHKILQYCNGEKWVGMGWKYNNAKAAGAEGQIQFMGADGNLAASSFLAWNNAARQLSFSPYGQTNANIRTRDTITNQFEWGHPNSAGYASTLGYLEPEGAPFVCFNCEASLGNLNRLRTRGRQGAILYSNLLGGFVFGTLANPNADSQTPTQLMSVLANGNVGVGNVVPQQRMHFAPNRPTSSAIRIDRNDGADRHSLIGHDTHGPYIQVSNNGDTITLRDNTGTQLLAVYPPTGNVGISVSPSYKLHVGGVIAGAGAYVNTSDARLKTNIQDISYGLETINKLHPVNFEWKDQTEDWQQGRKLGLIAQEVEILVPEAVSTAGDEQGTKSIAYADLVPVLIKAVQELSAEVERLKADR